MNIAKHNILDGLDYANSVYSNATLNYTVVPKCASSGNTCSCNGKNTPAESTR